ncbi:MAG: dihydropteroate synthase [Holosporales bacterium]|jgi:2-amino-4-hydroxy-6-hydroxymethyldihydropteridine diphosphokinase/dihydropteroate synthase|nr:dihydropteroate synthase [Holosporales bacterium]
MILVSNLQKLRPSAHRNKHPPSHKTIPARDLPKAASLCLALCIMIYLSLGSNEGDRLDHLRQACATLAEFFDIHQRSLVFETEAILPEGSPSSWNHPYANMIVAGESSLSPEALLQHLQQIECRLGRPPQHLSQAPRPIDLDILLYHNLKQETASLTIPQRELGHRPFLQALLALMGPPCLEAKEAYIPLRSFVLEPKIVGIVNVTPDSFSDGGQFLKPEAAMKRMQEMEIAGAAVIELGAQSTRPGYIEVPPKKEIARLAPILERYQGTLPLGIDTYYDEVAIYALQKSFSWFNDVKNQFPSSTLKKIAERGAKLVTLLPKMDLSWIERRIATLVQQGFSKDNIVLDPGIGFGKMRQENLTLIRTLSKFQEFGCPVMLAHARKSFISLLGPYPAEDRDIETLAFSQYATSLGIDYLRVHTVADHMRFLAAQQSLKYVL